MSWREGKRVKSFEGVFAGDREGDVERVIGLGAGRGTPGGARDEGVQLREVKTQDTGREEVYVDVSADSKGTKAGGPFGVK